MKRTIVLINVVALLLVLTAVSGSCKKEKTEPEPAPPAPVQQDTITTGWSKNSRFIGKSLSDIFFINNNTGFVLGGDSAYKSTDGGRTWQPVFRIPGGGFGFVELAMGSEQNICLGGQGNNLYISKNGGANFYEVVPGTSNTYGIYYSTPNTLFAAGKEIARSVNGGDNWQPVGTTTATTGTYANVFFLNATNGWYLCNAGLYQTTNGGDSWSKNNNFNAVLNNGTGVVQFTDVNTGYVSLQSGLYKTTNGGASWAALPSVAAIITENGTNSFPDIHFVSNTTGYYLTAGRVYRTTDGGTSWVPVIRLVNGRRSFIELHFTDANHGWVVSGDGDIFRFEQ